MSVWVLHPSEPAGWWIGFAPHSLESRALLQRIGTGEDRFVMSSDLSVRVLARIEDQERATAVGRLALPSRLSLTEIRTRFERFIETRVGRIVDWRALDVPIISNLARRFRIDQPDAALLWLAVREDTPLLVADDDLFDRLLPVSDLFPEFRVVLVGSEP